MPPEPLVVFVHVPRTGGKSLQTVLRRRLRGGYVAVGTFRDYDATLARVRALGAAADPSLRAIRGHVALGVRRWLPGDSRYGTKLRDPVERVLSHYQYVSERAPETRPFGLPPMPGDLTLEECVADGRYILDNLATRMLSDSPSPLGELTRARFLEAKRNLREAFLLAGLTERFDESLVLLCSLLGLPQATYRLRNDTPGRLARADVPPATLRLIEDRNRLDRELYEIASQQFDALVARQGPAFELDVDALRRARELQGHATAASRSGGSGGSDLRALLVEARARTLVAELERDLERDRRDRAQRRNARLRRRIAHVEADNEQLKRWKGKLKARLHAALQQADAR
jgi:hypothetical protein